MKTIKLFKITSVLFLFLGLGLFNQTKAQTTSWVFNDGNPKFSHYKIVEKSHNISEVYVVGGTTSAPTWAKCEIQKLDDHGYYTYIRVKLPAANDFRVVELNLYWDEEKLTRVKPDGTTKNFWLKK